MSADRGAVAPGSTQSYFGHESIFAEAGSLGAPVSGYHMERFGPSQQPQSKFEWARAGTMPAGSQSQSQDPSSAGFRGSPASIPSFPSFDPVWKRSQTERGWSGSEQPLPPEVSASTPQGMYHPTPPMLTISAPSGRSSAHTFDSGTSSDSLRPSFQPARASSDPIPFAPPPTHRLLSAPEAGVPSGPLPTEIGHQRFDSSEDYASMEAPRNRNLLRYSRGSLLRQSTEDFFEQPPRGSGSGWPPTNPPTGSMPHLAEWVTPSPTPPGRNPHAQSWDPSVNRMPTNPSPTSSLVNRISSDPTPRAATWTSSSYRSDLGSLSPWEQQATRQHHHHQQHQSHQSHQPHQPHQHQQQHQPHQQQQQHQMPSSPLHHQARHYSPHHHSHHTPSPSPSQYPPFSSDVESWDANGNSPWDHPPLTQRHGSAPSLSVGGWSESMQSSASSYDAYGAVAAAAGSSPLPRDYSWNGMPAEPLDGPQSRTRFSHTPSPPVPAAVAGVSRRSSSGTSKYSSSPLHMGMSVGMAMGLPAAGPLSSGVSSGASMSSSGLGVGLAGAVGVAAGVGGLGVNGAAGQSSYGYFDPATQYERSSAPSAQRSHYTRQREAMEYLQPNSYTRGNVGTFPPGRQRTMPTTAMPSPMSGAVGGPVGALAPQAMVGRMPIARRTPTGEVSRRETDSPTNKDRFKDFTRILREREKESFAAAVEYFDANIHTLPDRSHYRAYLEMADIAKRDNNIESARAYFQRASIASPVAPQVWLEWAKLEEECGELTLCQSILKKGLLECPLVEALLIKGVKHEERLQSLSGARAMLSRLLTSEADKSWRMLSEGAMLEARAGRIGVARQVFRFLMQAVPSHGPILYDAVQLEERCGCYDSALHIAERGLAVVPRYGPLWFKVLRLMEKLKQPLTQLRTTASEALHNVSREMLWKVCYEQAQFEARAGLMGDARLSYAHAVRYCPKNLRWKIWLGSARTELGDGHMITARALLGRAALEVPRKTRAIVLLERSRLEEYDGRLDAAREILAVGCNEARFEWKIFLEAVLVEYRAGRVAAAVEQGRRALECHPGTGRLWAVLIQLHQVEGEEAQLAMFRRALQQVPKSGEVWCEGARLRLNPLSTQFDLVVARRCLDFAIQFTPQYGDSFVEYLRLELLQAGSTRALEDLLRSSVNADPNYGALWCHCRQDYLDDADQVLHAALNLIQGELYATRTLYAHALVRGIRRSPPLCLPQEVVAEPMAQLWRRPGATCVLCQSRLDAMPVVTLACMHSFHETCAKAHALPQSATCGFDHAEKSCPLCSEPWCVVRYFCPSLPSARPRDDAAAAAAATAGMSGLFLRSGSGGSRQSSGSSDRPSPRNSGLLPPEDSNDVGLSLVDLGYDLACLMGRSATRAAPLPETEDPMPVAQPTHTPHDFVTGLVQLNRDYCRAGQLPSALRQKILFGSDFVVP